jgi:L,D-transpeptidase-like protein
MKNKVIAAILSAFVSLIISCSAVDNNKAPEELAAKKVAVPRSKKTTKAFVAKKPSNKSFRKAPALDSRASEISNYASQHGYSTKYCFLVDMSIPSGRNRFFVYDLEDNSVACSGLVAHGCCNETFMSHPKFSNSSNSGCSSLGKYKVGAFYTGKYGASYRLYGLDNSNSNAFQRGVVIHGYDCVPDKEIYPMVLCNSLGCPMVSYNFFDRLSHIINHSEKPIVLWIYR